MEGEPEPGKENCVILLEGPINSSSFGRFSNITNLAQENIKSPARNANKVKVASIMKKESALCIRILIQVYFIIGFRDTSSNSSSRTKYAIFVLD